GMPTFGKGSVQELIELKDGSSLRVTVAKWYTPNGRSIDDEGISPTIEVGDNPDTDEDEQFIRAREELLRLAEQR
ncbi:MAG: S41 family peptidase, partial [Acidobacteriota bacterium]